MKTAIILAAGRGTKIWPYCSTRQKAALPLANKPLVRWSVEKLLRSGIERIIVVVGYRKEQVISALAGIENIEFVEQQGAGTVGALLSAIDLVEEDRFVVLYGDLLLTFNALSNFIREQKTAGAICAALVHSLGTDRPQDWMCADVTGDQVRAVIGHPREAVTHRIAGLFAFARSFIRYLQQNCGHMQSLQVGTMPPDEPQLEDSIQAAIENGESVFAVETSGITFDLDKPWHYLEASYHWTEHVCSQIGQNAIGQGAKISDGADIHGAVVAGDRAEIGKGVIVEGNLIVGADTKIVQGAILDPNVIVGEQCTIRRYCQIERNSTIGSHCYIGHGAEVSGLFLHRAFAYHYGEYWGILGDNSDLGAATVCGNLRFDDQNSIHLLNDRRETPCFGANAAYLGDFVRTGVNAIIMPGVKIGPWSVIGAGTVVRDDVPDNTLLYVKQEQIKRQWGPKKYGW
ncbi:NTP transferase domain-containing protein [candidate division KSB1 bacterium]|nr:NTP transferase domain-containing protein [candidate division KSB1 bacterium]RQW08780.1 MAG: nucleotidyl transferase [candidate division KSB1 bacterium]